MHSCPFVSRSIVRVMFSLACLFTSGLVVGCGKDIDVVPVSGQITNMGQPAADVHVSFQPVSKDPNHPNVGRGSVAVTDTDGHYQLETVYPELDGAVPGTHIVRLSTNYGDVDTPDDASDMPADTISLKFRDGSLEFEVSAEGTDKADFDIGT